MSEAARDPRPLRVAMTIGQLAVGGAEFQSARLGAALAARGHDVTIWTKQPIDPVVADQAVGVRIVEVPSLGGMRGVGKYVFSAALGQRLIADRPQIIHVHQLVEYHLLPSLWAGRRLGAPVVVKLAGGGKAENNSDLLWLGRHPLWGRHLVRQAAAGVDCAVAITSEVEQEVRAAGFRRVERIPNGVEVVEPAPLEPPYDVLFAGRLHRVKGLDVLLSAWAIVEREVPEARLSLAGDGPMRAALQEQARSLGLARVRFLGNTPRPVLDARCQVLALASRAEGMSNVLLEGMSRGLPIVATAVGGNRDLVEHDRSGLLVPAEDPRPLAEAICALLRDPARAQRLGAAAREVIQSRHRIDVIAARYAALYEDLLRERGGR